MICNICCKDKDTCKYDELDVCEECTILIEEEKKNPRVCKPDDV